METALYTILSGAAGITALVGTHIYPVIIDQGADWTSAITFQRTSGRREHAMSGPTGLVESRYSINCWGKPTTGASAYKNAKDLAQAVVAVLLPDGGYTGTVDGITIQGIFLIGEDDQREDAAGIGLVARTRLDFIIWHTEG